VITKVIDAVVAALKLQAAFTGKNVVPSYDQSLDLDDSDGVIIAVTGASEAAIAGADGRPIAWNCNISLLACTHRAVDKNGSVRKALSEAAHDFFMSLDSLIVTGYSLAGVTSVRESETSVIGENYIAMPCLASLVITKST